MRKKKTIPFDGSEFFDTPASQVELLADALESGHGGYITQAFGVVARARGMTAIAKEAGVTREALYKALSEDGDPKLSTLLAVAKALGVKLSADLADKDKPPKQAAE